MTPLRITILQGAFFPVPPVRGGAVEKLWTGLAVEFARAGHAVTQVSRQVPELPATETREGVQHRRVRGYDQPAGMLRLKWRDFCYTWRALRAAPDGDVIVTNSFWAPLLASRRHGKIYVSVERMPKGQMRLYRRAARLRACSQAVAQGIVAEAPALAERVIAIPNPLPFKPVTAVDWAAKQEEILYVGRIHPVKGVALLLEAFVRAKQNGQLGPGWRLTFAGPAEAGKGGGGVEWWQGVMAKSANPDVKWVGPIYDVEQLNGLYQRARILAYPTLDVAGEAMPIAPLEAMAWGCLPVVSALACFRDYVRPDENGIMFDHTAPDPAATLGAALAQAAKPERALLARAALAVRVSHDLGAMAGRFLEDFRQITARGRP